MKDQFENDDKDDIKLHKNVKMNAISYSQGIK